MYKDLAILIQCYTKVPISDKVHRRKSLIRIQPVSQPAIFSVQYSWEDDEGRVLGYLSIRSYQKQTFITPYSWISKHD